MTNENSTRHFGDILKSFRSQKSGPNGKISQSEMVEKLGEELGEEFVKIGTYQSWEQGNTPSLDKVCKLATYFGVSVDYLLGRSSETTVVQVSEGTKIKYDILKAPQNKHEDICLNVFEQVIDGADADRIIGEQGGDIEGLKLDTRESDLKCLQRLLMDAIYGGMVQVEAESENGNEEEASGLAEDLKERFGVLREARVFDLGAIRDDFYFLKTVILGMHAADFLKQEAKPGSIIGISNGYTVSRVLKAPNIGRGDLRNITAFPITVTNCIDDLPAAAITFVSNLVYDHQGYEVEAEVDQERIASRADTADIILMGLGSIQGLLARVLKKAKLSENDRKTLHDAIMEDTKEQNPVVGDILYTLMRENGELYKEIGALVKYLDEFGIDTEDTSKYNPPIRAISHGQLERLVHRTAPATVMVVACEPKQSTFESGTQFFGKGTFSKGPITRVCFEKECANVLFCDTQLANAALEKPK